MPKPITYVPIGDSYTAGTGATPEDAWPVLLVESLQDEGFDIEMPVNPAQNGWTSKQAVELEIPVLRRNNATFSTLLIGANDLVQGVSANTYRKNVQLLLDTMVNQTKGKVIVLTIPDFTLTPVGNQFGRDMPVKIQAFNTILTQEAAKRNLTVIDLYAHSTKNSMIISEDKLHPSAAEYARWEVLVLAAAKNVLS